MIRARKEGTFKKLDLFTVDEVFGGWKRARAVHFQRERSVRSNLSDQIRGETAMAEFDAKRIEDGQTRKRLSPEIEQEILRAIARIDYGSIEVVIHDGKVVQIECREKIRVVRDEPGRRNAIRQIRQPG
jgi:hypothetical protein